jgi:hypothetical protein
MLSKVNSTTPLRKGGEREIIFYEKTRLLHDRGVIRRVRNDIFPVVIGDKQVIVTDGAIYSPPLEKTRLCTIILRQSS